MTHAADDRQRPEVIASDPNLKPGRWVVRVVLVLVLVVVGLLAYKAAASFVPRWWAQQVADQTQGKFFRGLSFGLLYGFVFSCVPLLVLFQIRRRFISWAWKLIIAVLAAALAAPNWLTLFIVLGSTPAARAGNRIFDVDAPWFRGGTAIGAALGAALALVLTGASMWMKHRKNQVRRLRTELDDAKRREFERTAEFQAD